MDAQSLAREIVHRARDSRRFIAAIAGPPGSGKSTLATELVSEINAIGEKAALIAMDGFHLDNIILRERGLESRKGTPETFDFDGFVRALSAIRSSQSSVYLPIFDRSLDLARAGATAISTDVRIMVAEGNYLLLKSDPWADLEPMFDLTILLDVSEAELEQRLIQRWLDYGHDQSAAEARARGNDMANVRLVIEQSRCPDIQIKR